MMGTCRLAAASARRRAPVELRAKASPARPPLVNVRIAGEVDQNIGLDIAHCPLDTAGIANVEARAADGKGGDIAAARRRLHESLCDLSVPAGCQYSHVDP